ncbi:hypothetical protein [Agrococcus carbonis]|nr:hypothetical protein [Agrococcus carbonis]
MSSASATNWSGNALAVLGDASSRGSEGSATATSSPYVRSHGSDGLLSGNQQVWSDAEAMNVSGNAVALLGDASSHHSDGWAEATSSPRVHSSGSDGMGSGNQQVMSSASATNWSGNALAVLGDATSRGSYGSAEATSSPYVRSHGSDGVLSGNQQVMSDASAMNVSGNAVALLGDAHSSWSEGSAEATSSPRVHSSGSDGMGSGNQQVMSAASAENWSGNALAVLGDASSRGSYGSAEATSSPYVRSHGSDGLLSGNQQVTSDAEAMNVSGNAVALLGDARSHHSEGWAEATSSPRVHSSGSDGVLSGNQQVTSSASATNWSGNALAMGGDATSRGSYGSAEATSSPYVRSHGSDGLLSGNQQVSSEAEAMNVSGNAVALFGDAHSSWSEGSAEATSSPRVHSSGSDGMGSGNQQVMSAASAENWSGNALAVLGDASSRGSYGSAEATSSPYVRSHGSDGLLSGNQQVTSDAEAMNVSGNAVALLGDARSHHSEGWAEATSSPRVHSSGSDGVLSGNQQVTSSASATNWSGNALAMGGDATSRGSYGSAEATSSPYVRSHGSDGLLSGNQQVSSEAEAMNVSGNAVALFGDAHSSWSEGSAEATSSPRVHSSGSDGVLSGNQQVTSSASAENWSGNALAVFGDATSRGSEGSAEATSSPYVRSSGSGGLMSGNQQVSSEAEAMNVSGNAVALFGDARSHHSVGSARATSSPTVISSGSGGVLSGNQQVTSTAHATNWSGNAIAVFGDATSVGSVGSAVAESCPMVISGSDRWGHECGEESEPPEEECPEPPKHECPEPPEHECPEPPQAECPDSESPHQPNPEQPGKADDGGETGAAGDGRASLPAAAAELPVTGADASGLALPALVLLALGMMLMRGRRRERTMS